jgi:urease accessory protein
MATTTAITTTTTTVITITTMITDGGFYRLLAWTSPSYPVGAFSYSHGLEWAMEAGDVRDAGDLGAYVAAVLKRGGGWIDAVLFVHAWRAAGDEGRLDEISELAAAFRGSAETALESRQQGRSFLAVTRKAWPHPWLDAFSERQGTRPVAHVVAMALACAAHGLPLEASLAAYLHGVAANLVSAGVRLAPLGQTDGQIVIASLGPVVEAVTAAALEVELDDLGAAAPGLELCSLAHETQYTRLFRS